MKQFVKLLIFRNSNKSNLTESEVIVPREDILFIDNDKREVFVRSIKSGKVTNYKLQGDKGLFFLEDQLDIPVVEHDNWKTSSKEEEK